MTMSSMRRFLVKISVVVSLSYLSSFHVMADTTEWEPASQVIVASTDKILGIINNTSIPAEEKKAALIQLLQQVVDYPVIARGVMGKYFRRASEQQFQLFLIEFQSSLENTIANALISFKIDDYVLQPGTDDTRAGREKVLIRVKAGNVSYDIQYTLSSKSGQWQVSNLSLDGINIGLSFRNQFIGSMGKHNNDMDLVIANWNKPSY